MPSAGGPFVFISYRRDDAEGHAGHLAEWLVRRFGRDNVFRDIDNVRPGEDFVARITGAIQSCDVVLVLIGRRWLATDASGQRRIDSPRDYVRLEIEAALSHGVRTIPVLFQNADMPGESELPEAIAALSRLHASTISSGRWEHDVERLLDVIGGPRPAAPVARGPAAPGPSLAGSLLGKARGLKDRLDNWPHPLPPRPDRPPREPPAAMTDPPGPRSFCRRCGQGFVEGAKFCRKCGTPSSAEA